MNPGTVRDALRNLGVPAEKGRTSAIRQLVLQAPAPVIAQALGYHDKSATRIATEAAAPWKHDAAGDHTRVERPPSNYAPGERSHHPAASTPQW